MVNNSDVITAIKKGDHNSFKEFYQQYYKLMIHYAYLHTRSSDISRDLVQDLFFNIWKNRARLDPGQSISAYLYKSLHNLIINHFKHSSSRMLLYENIIDEKSISYKRDISFEIDFDELLKKLPEKIKMVFVLNKIEGYKYQEIAEICDISVKTVEKRMSIALKYFRKFLTKYFLFLVGYFVSQLY